MNENIERRSENRLRYHWPGWYAENFEDILYQGQMVDVCSGGAAFTCHADDTCPYPGQEVTTRVSIPRFGADDSFDLTSFVRTGRVCRVEGVNNFVRRVAVQFAKLLPFKPGEVADTEALEVDVAEGLEPIETIALVEEVNERLETVEAEAFAEDIDSGTEPVETEIFTEDVGENFESVQI